MSIFLAGAGPAAYPLRMVSDTRTQTRDKKASGWRGSRRVWLEAAKQAIVDAGVEAVKIQPLATQLGIARTSFYWFFKDRQALLDALLEEWDAKNTGAFVTACGGYAETLPEAILNLIVVFHDEALFDPQLDFAIRGWAQKSDTVAERIRNADAVRLDAIRSMFDRFDLDPDEADVRARTVYLTQIGYISMQTDEPPETRIPRAPGYVKTFCGIAPSDAETARFHARLGYRERQR